MVTTTDLVSYYKCDTNGTFTDSHGSNTGTIDGATYTASGKINGGYTFDDTNDWVDVSNIINDVSSDTSGTISLWFKTPATLTVNKALICCSDFSSGNYVMLFLYPNKLAYYFNTLSDSTHNRAIGGTTLSANTWYHVVWRSDGTNTDIYLNGSKETLSFTVGSQQGSWMNDLNANWDTVAIGCLRRASSTYFIGGTIDEIGWWSRALTTTEITDLYNSGSGLAYPFSAATNIQVNIADTWKTVDSMKINISDTWKTVSAVKQNIGDTWKTI